MADDKKVEVEDHREEEEEEEEEEADEEEGDGEEWTDDTGSSDVDSPSPPSQIVVSHVCRHWRNVALSTPSLWTTIEVPSRTRPPYENVSIMLDHNKAFPIDISINDPELDFANLEGDPHAEDNLKFLYSLLVPHVQRWRSIRVDTSTYHAIYAFLSAVSDPSVPAASQLATLQLYHDARYNCGGIELKLSNRFTLFGDSAPNLTTLVLLDVHVDWNQGWIASASNLRYLKLKWQGEDVRPTRAQFATILRGAPQFQTLGLFASGLSGEPTDWVFEPTPGRSTSDLNAPIQLLKLTHLVLAPESPSSVIGLLSKLYLPSLKSLTLCLGGEDYTDLIDQMARPATSLSYLSVQEQPHSLLSNLEKLRILRLLCRMEGIETLYSELQNLHSLDLSSVIPVHLVELLCQPCTLPGRGDIWLPRLSSLWMSYYHGNNIRRVVQKRKAH